MIYTGHMLSDVKRAIPRDHETHGVDPTFRGLAESIAYAGSTPVTGMKPELWVGMITQWDINYSTQYGSPEKTADDQEEN
jgi:hypothetical protein